MDILEIFGVIVLFNLISNYFFRESSHQLSIDGYLYQRFPKLLLELAKINKGGDFSFGDLSKEEGKRLRKYTDKLNNCASVRLTFLYLQNLIHVQSEELNWFFAIDSNGGGNLVQETIGKIDDKTDVEFVLYRRKGNLFKSPVLVGYLHRVNEYGLLKDEDKKVEVLFEFPENLITSIFLRKILMSIYKIKKDDIFVGPSKNELGDDNTIYCINYKQERDGDGGFEFRVYHP